MRTRLMITVLLPLAFAAACAGRKAAPVAVPAAASEAVFVESGFLTSDYAELSQVQPGSARRVYQNPNRSFASYDKIFVDRITIWRDHHEQIEEVDSEDFQKVVDDLYAVMTRELGKTFNLVTEPGPGVARMRVALVAIDDPDDRLDIYVSHGKPLHADADEPLPPGLREFGRNAWMEAEMLDGVTDEPIFAVADRVADVIPRSGPIETWHDLHEALDAWAVQATGRLAEVKKQG